MATRIALLVYGSTTRDRRGHATRYSNHYGLGPDRRRDAGGGRRRASRRVQPEDRGRRRGRPDRRAGRHFPAGDRHPHPFPHRLPEHADAGGRQHPAPRRPARPAGGDGATTAGRRALPPADADAGAGVDYVGLAAASFSWSSSASGTLDALASLGSSLAYMAAVALVLENSRDFRPISWGVTLWSAGLGGW